MRLSAFAVSDIGCLRRENEDSYLCDEQAGLFGVADGIGGLPGGAQASQQALVALQNWLGRQGDRANLDYEAALREVNEIVHDLGRRISPRCGIGTTLTVGHLQADALHLLHVGDSFLFRLRHGSLEVLTSEHNVANEMKLRAARGQSPFGLHDNPAALTRCIGQPPPIEGDHSAHLLSPGDRYLFCTDGITRCISHREIVEHLRAAIQPEGAARALVTLANNRGGLDNSTAVVLFVD